MLQCQPCSCGCFSVSDTGTSIAAVLTISYYCANHQLNPAAKWMLQCQPCSYGCFSVSDTGTSIAAVLTISYHYANHQLNPAAMSTLKTQACSYGCPSVKATGASIAAVLTHTWLRSASSSPCVFFTLFSQPLLLPAYHYIYWVTKIPEKPVAHVKRACCPHGHVLSGGIVQLLRIQWIPSVFHVDSVIQNLSVNI